MSKPLKESKMNDELLELCKEVYEKTGWNNRENQIDSSGIIHGQLKYWGAVPLYTSDYLLEKLPHKITNRVGHYLEVCPVTPNGFKWWRASYTYEPFAQYADTPLKALLKLVIALDEIPELDKQIKEFERE